MKIPAPVGLGDDLVALRLLAARDAAPFAAAFADDPHLGQLLGTESDPDEQQVSEQIQHQGQRAEDGRGIQLAIVEPATDAFLGSVSLHSFDWHSRRCEVGFWVTPAARGRGVASAAVTLAVSWAMRELDLLRVEMTTTPENPAVPALARRLGFTREGILRARNVERGQRVDIHWFGVLREEWPGAPKP